MRKLLDRIQFILHADESVSLHNEAAEWRIQAGITLISAAGYLVMSLLNVLQHSWWMLGMTGGTALLLVLSWGITVRGHRLSFLSSLYLLINVVVLTEFTVRGGNHGFAALWLILTPFVAMFIVDLKKGFIVSLYFLAMLILVMSGPMRDLLQYDYNDTFRLRFPFLFTIGFAIATFIAIRSRLMQYELLEQQREIARVSATDIGTGLLNRNSFYQYCDTVSREKLASLSAVFLDVNGLHVINNREGHEAGDLMLKCIAEKCIAAFSPDTVYRIGGDEILILPQNRTKVDLEQVMIQMKTELAASRYSISCGIAEGKMFTTISEMVAEADKQMLADKEVYYSSNHLEHR